MRQKKVVFREQEIVEFCKATKDTNQIHDPEVMGGLGKHVIVPGMFALSFTMNLSADFLRTKANTISVFFNSLISSGDLVTLSALPDPECSDEIRLSAVHEKDTLTSKVDYSRIYHKPPDQGSDHPWILRRSVVSEDQVKKFASLIEATDNDVAQFLFAIAYASNALLFSIRNPMTQVEAEIDQLINTDQGISPFYHKLEILFPEEFPVFTIKDSMDYFIHFEREKKNRLYVAHVRCENNGKIIFHAKINLMGIADQLIIRMAKQIRPQVNPV